MNFYDLTLVDSKTLIAEDYLTLGQLCQACDTTAEWIISLVEEGIIQPLEKDRYAWYFSGASLMRARCALRLQQDLGINLTGLGLVLDLMEELDFLCSQVKLTAKV